MRFELGMLPLLTFLVWTAALYLRGARRDLENRGLRNSILQTASLFGLWVVIGTEGLSAISQLKFVPILLCWIIALGAGALVVARHRDQLNVRPGAHAGRRQVLAGRVEQWAVSSLFLAILSLALGSAVFNPPNNYDSYSYHLPRQVFWLQHANVRFYPTNNLRQLMMAPFTEYVGVHLMAHFKFRSLEQSDSILRIADHVLRRVVVDRTSRRWSGRADPRLLDPARQPGRVHGGVKHEK